MSKARKHLAQQFQTLSRELRPHERHSSEVTTGSIKARDKFATYRVGSRGHDNGNRRRCVLGSLNGCRSCCDNQIDFEPDEFSGQLGEQFGFSLGPTVLNHDVFTIGPTQIP